MATVILTLCMCSCQDWNEQDAPAGDQQIPVLTKVGSYSFESLEGFQVGTYENGQNPEIIKDQEIGSKVLYLNDGYIYGENPLTNKRLESGASATMWIKLAGEDVQVRNTDEESEETIATRTDGKSLLAFMDDTEKSKLVITSNAGLIYNGAALSEGFSELTPDIWHYVAINIGKDGYTVYLDGEEWGTSSLQTEIYNQLVDHLTSVATRLYIGYGLETPPGEFWMEDLKIYKDLVGKNEIKRPGIGTTTIGATDFSTGFLGAFSEVLSAEGDVIYHYQFKNYTKGVANHQNWMLLISNGKAIGEEGYQEYALVRADAYGWLSGNSENTIPDSGYPLSDVYGQFGSWEKFRSEMNGAVVDLTVTRYGTSITMNAVIISQQDKKYTYSWYHPTIAGEGTVGVFLSVDNAYLEVENKETSVTPLEIQNGQLGFSDYSTAFNTMFTEPIILEDYMEVVYEFTNYTQGPGNEKNWYLVFTNGKTRGQEGYIEHAIIRADNWGWLNGLYDAEHTLLKMDCAPSCDYDWNTFVSDMNEANVKMTVKRRAGKISFYAAITTKDNKKYSYYWMYTLPADVDVISSCLTVDNSYLVMKNSPVAMSFTEPSTQLGASDFTTGWWQAFSPVISATGTNASFKYTFTNHNRCLKVWENWAVAITNGTAFGDPNYKEYVVIRADNFGWVGGNDQLFGFETNLPDYTWALNGAKVVLTITRDNKDIKLNADITTESGISYYYKGTLTGVITDVTNTIGTFLTLDSAYLTDITSEATNGEDIKPSIVTVGATDYSTGWWGAFSDVMTLDGDGEIHYRFINHTKGENNAQNWYLVISNGIPLGTEGYVEYAAIRSDWYGWWGGNGDNLIQRFANYNWDTYKVDMQGAIVEISLKRQGNIASMKADITTTSGTRYWYVCNLSNLPLAGRIGTFLTVENSYLDIYTEESYTTSDATIGVGNSDCNIAWWGIHSPIKTAVGDGCSFEYEFINNHGSNAATWNNWVLVLSNGKYSGEAGYTEYFVLLANNTGWKFGEQSAYLGLETNLPTDDTFNDVLHGATVKLKVTRNGTSLEVDATITATNNAAYYYRGTIANVFPDATSTIGTFFTTDMTYLQIKSAKATDGQ